MKAPLPTSSSSPSSSRYNTKNSSKNNNTNTVARNDSSAKKTTELFNKTIDKITIPIRNDLPIAAAVETKVMGAHHHRHRSLVHHYSPLMYVPTHRPNNSKENHHPYRTKEGLEDNGKNDCDIDDEKDKMKKPSTITTAFTTAASTSIPISPLSTTTKNNRCSIASTAIGEEDALELLQQHQQISRIKKESIIVLLGECLLKSGCPGHRAVSINSILVA